MRGWVPFFVALHITAFVLIAVIIRANDFVDPAIFRAIDESGSKDAIHAAAQLGRLDIVSLILAMFGILLGLLAVFGFAEIRVRAREVAQECAETEARALMEKFLDGDALAIIRAHVEYLLPPQGSTDGDDIALAYKETGADDDESA